MSEHNSDSTLFHVQHLATFTVGSKQGLLKPEDGMRKLRILEKSQGLWPVDCDIKIDKNVLIVIEKGSGQEIEVIPIQLINDATSVANEDEKDPYNNILQFTVLVDAKRKLPEMHLFQCVKQHSSEIVNEILKYKFPKAKLVDQRILEMHYGHNPKIFSQYRFNAPPSVNNQLKEQMENDLKIINHCFDDIERFVTRLQDASVFSRELENKTTTRNKKELGDGIKSLRAQMPSQKQFYDILQKFKLSFNLLAKLKVHIHNPNAPELVHFLFTPLALVVNASKNFESNRELAKTVASPLLTKAAIDLLTNCLTTREQNLWDFLGDAWKTSREEARQHNQYQHIEPFHPVFFNGWAPKIDHHDATKEHSKEIARLSALAVQQQQTSKPQGIQKTQLQQQQPQNLKPVTNTNQNQRPLSSAKFNGPSLEQQNDEVKNWANNLHLSGLRVYEVLHDRQSNNDKELSVKASDFVEVLDDRRNWWRVRNFYGQIGHVPNTLLRPYELQNA